MMKRRCGGGPDWSELPVDIVRSVFGRTSYVDQIRCRNVCKSWRLAIGDKLPNNFPLMFLLCETEFRPKEMEGLEGEARWWWRSPSGGEDVMVDPKLFDPWVHELYLLPRRSEFDRIKRSRILVLESKKGWLLMAKKPPGYSKSHSGPPNPRDLPKNDDGSQGLPLFLYSPFRNQIVNLPTWYGPGKVAAVSFADDDSCFVVFAVSFLHRPMYHIDVEGNWVPAYWRSEITVSTCRVVLGDAAATSTSYWSKEPSFLCPALDDDGRSTTQLTLQSVVYLKGTFYCLFPDLVLGGFEVSTRQWRWLATQPQHCLLWQPAGGMLEFDGKLVVKDIVHHYDPSRFTCLTLDFDAGEWVPTDDVEHMRFQCSTNRTSFFALPPPPSTFDHLLLSLPSAAKDSTFVTEGILESYSISDSDQPSWFPLPQSTRAAFYDELSSLKPLVSVWIRPS